MWTIKYSTQFKKDLKRYQNQIEKLKDVNDVICELRNTGCVQNKKMYPLSGNWSGYLECNIQNDLLLIWINESSSEIKIARLGTHAELFKK